MTDPVSPAPPIRHIALCGDGLAAWMTLAALTHQLPDDIRLTLVRSGDARSADRGYGTVTAPSAYAFNLSAGVEEPALLLGSDTGFSWGTRYAAWGGDRAWMQAFALPLPVLDGVLFHQHLALVDEPSLEPYLAGVQAARYGKFAHPPQEAGDGAPHPLSRADYGYHLDPAAYAAIFAAAVAPGRVTIVDATIAQVRVADGAIADIGLRDGQRIDADLYVDCTGPDARLLAALDGAETPGGRRIAIATADAAPPRPDRPYRSVTATPHGWTSDTPLTNRTRRLAVFDPAEGDAAMTALGPAAEAPVLLSPGRRAQPWVGNCVAIGQAAAVVEPVTPAPLMLLERDIERLLTLIPNAGAMTVERREYNRRFDEDHTHAMLFDRALFIGDGFPDTPYWRAAQDAPIPEKLARKIAMFESRGLLVAYDLEPFHPEDWVVLHRGMGRRGARHDRLADRADPGRLRAYLATMRREIEQAVARMPDSGSYRTRIETYLRRTPR